MNKPQPQQKQNKKQAVSSLVALIEQKLSAFTSSKDFANVLAIKDNENQHSQAFCLFMGNQAKSKYSFMREVAQKGSATIDIGVYKGSILIFTIEAKVLPMPEPRKIGKSRDEHEYVYRSIGSGAGIQRFKENKHGLDDKGNLLLENGMIAYIKEHDFPYWLNQVNKWIINAGWSMEETLKQKYHNQPDKYISEHTRNDDLRSKLTLHHFWVIVSPKKNTTPTPNPPHQSPS